MEVQRKYGGLRTIARLVIVLSWIVLVGGVAFALMVWLRGGDPWFGSRNFLGVLALPLSVYFFLQLFITGSLLSLMTDLEQNTRANTEALVQLHRLMQASKEAAPAPPPPPAPPSQAPAPGPAAST